MSSQQPTRDPRPLRRSQYDRRSSWRTTVKWPWVPWESEAWTAGN